MRLGRILPLFAPALGIATPLAAQDTVTVGVGAELSAPLYEDLRVPVFADLRKAGTEKLGSYTVRVTWNPAVLSYQRVDSGAFAVPLVQSDSTFYGVLWLSGISVPGAGGVVGLANVVLYVNTAGGDTIRVQATELSAAGTLRNLFTTTTVVHQPAPFCTALGRWGDLDRDGLANSRDALAMLSSIVGLPTTGFDLTLGDVDGDGLTNSRDALIVLSYAVGIDIPGQRVLLVAGGLCTPGAAPQLVVVPDTADIVVNQQVRLVALARDPSGQLTGLQNLRWEVENPRIAAVDYEGFLIGREPGITRAVAAVGPGVRATATVVTRQRRGTWHVDAARAKRSPVQMGTTRYPFSTWERAAPIASEGDTIRIAPGVHDYEEIGGTFRVGVLIVGDTLPDGTRPVLRGSPASYDYAFSFDGGARAEIRNLVLRGFYTALDVQYMRSLRLDNVAIEHTALTYGYGIYARSIDTLDILRSALIGDSTTNSYYGVYLWDRARLLRVHDSRISRWGCYGLYISAMVDSLDIRRNEINQNGCTGIYASSSLPTGMGVYLAANRLVDDNGAMEMHSVRNLVLDHNYLEVRTGDGIWVTGPNTTAPVPGTRLTSLRDSIRFRSPSNHWLYVDDLDSVLIDSLWLQSSRDTAMVHHGDVYGNVMRLKNSQLLNLSYEGVDFRGRHLIVENTQFTGCGVPTAGLCDWAGAVGLTATAHVDSGPAVTLLNSTFFSMEYALLSSTSNTRAGPMVLTGNMVDSVAYGFAINADSVLATDNVLTRIRSTGIESEPSYSNRPFRTAVTQRNQVTCVVSPSYTSYGLYSYYAPTLMEDNTVNGCEYGLYGYNISSYPLANFTARRNAVVTDTTRTLNTYGIRPDGRWRVVLYGNRVKDGAYGLYLAPTDTAAMRMDSNAVSLTRTAGMYISASVPATGTKNNVANNLLDGILNAGTGARSLTLGRITGNFRYGVSSSVAFDATQNWWGDPLGVRGRFGNPSSTGDSVSSAVIAHTSPLGSDPGDVPPLLPGPMLGPEGFAAFVAAPASAPVSRPGAHREAVANRRAGVEALAQQQRAAREAERARIHQEARRRREELERLRARAPER